MIEILDYGPGTNKDVVIRGTFVGKIYYSGLIKAWTFMRTNPSWLYVSPEDEAAALEKSTHAITLLNITERLKS